MHPDSDFYMKYVKLWNKRNSLISKRAIICNGRMDCKCNELAIIKQLNVIYDDCWNIIDKNYCYAEALVDVFEAINNKDNLSIIQIIISIGDPLFAPCMNDETFKIVRSIDTMSEVKKRALIGSDCEHYLRLLNKNEFWYAFSIGYNIYTSCFNAGRVRVTVASDHRIIIYNYIDSYDCDANIEMAFYIGVLLGMERKRELMKKVKNVV